MEKLPAHSRSLWSCLQTMLITCTLATSALAWAGPVNSPQSYPYAQSNAAGAFLTAGDLKTLIYTRDATGRERTAALTLASRERIFPLFTGGLAADAVQSFPGAIACSNAAIALYDPTRTAAHPGGQWRSVAWDRPSSARTPLQCSMTEDGHYAWLDSDGATLTIDGEHVLALPWPAADSRLLQAGQGFWLVHPNGQAIAAHRSGSSWNWGIPSQHTLGRFTSWSRLASNGRGVLRADADGVWLATLEADRFLPALRLPVNPCAEEQACGVSLAADDSWLVSGYWGHYLGRAQSFIRLDIPLAATEEFGVAIAHQGLPGAYIYLGADDGDRGQLPPWTGSRVTSKPEAPESGAAATRPQTGQRWLVWQRSISRLGPTRLPLALPVPLLRRQPLRLSEAADLTLTLWTGPLPKPLPPEWIAWEAEQTFAFAAPRAASTPQAWPPWWWGDMQIGAARARAAAAGLTPAEVAVAVIDSGIAPTHPWLQLQLDIHAGEITGNELDDDDNGLVDDVWGYDFVEEDALPQDTFGHGTHVAGLLAAHQSDGELSIAPNLRLTVVRALDRYGKSNSIDLARALQYAVDSGAQLINCSWGGGADTQALRDAFGYALAQGRTVIASAGNDRLDTDTYPEVPKKYSGVISVTAHAPSGRLADFANYGQRSVTWSTPGTEIVSTMKDGTLGAMSGTSMATPLATGSMAWIYGLLRSRFPATAAPVLLGVARDVLCRSADPRGIDKKLLCGRIRLDQATELALKWKPNEG